VIAPISPACGSDCTAFVAKWSEWWSRKARQGLAVLDCSPDYLEIIGRKSRNMVSKANRLYVYEVFDFNEYLADIDAINASKAVRQQRPMSGWYIEPASPSVPARLCAAHGDSWHGAFRRDDHTLMAFARLARVSDELGILVSFLGHAEASAAMNGMIAHLVATAGVERLNYLHMRSATPSLEAFKRRLGFREVFYA